jgi:hypothetical protein
MRARFALAVWIFVCGGGTAHPAAAGPWPGWAAFGARSSAPDQAGDGQEGAGAGPAGPLPGQAAPAAGQPPAASVQAPAADPTPSPAAGVAKFLAGSAIGFCAHEAGHLAFDYTFDASPGFRRVSFGPLPFFAITHNHLSPRREFTVSSAGFWVQQLGNEVLLTARPQLRGERAPMAKGLLAFNILTSMAYAGTAIAHAGPRERDTRGMAIALGVDESAVGAMLLVPAALDTVRYYRPSARWATWASRGAKAAMVLLVTR